MSKLKVAFIGLSHIHLSNLSAEFYKESDRVELLGAAEYPPFTKEEVEIKCSLNLNKRFDIKIWDDYKELLDMKPDIAVVCSTVSQHADIATETLSRGIHTILEKPMAMTMDDAKRIYKAYKNSTAELIINWPIAWFPAFNLAKKLADEGKIGKIHRVHYRGPSTRGPYKLGEYSDEFLSKLWWYKKEEGGGAISDYAGYGCALSTWITGKTAKKVYALSKNFFLPFSDVDDYSVFTIDFGDSVGLVEGSWSTMSNGEVPTGPVIFGSEGVIVADRFDTKVKVYKTFIPYVKTPEPEEVYDTPSPDGYICKNVLGFLLEGKPLHEMVTADFNMRVMAAFDAGVRSADSEKAEEAFDPFEI